MEDEEAGKGELPHGGASPDDLHNGVPHDRDGASDAGTHLGGPISPLVPRQGGPGEAHPQCQDEEDHPQEPGHLPWLLVRAPDEDPGHVEGYQDNHGVGPPVVETVDEPAERNRGEEEVQAVVGVVHRGNVVEELPHAGHNLEQEDEEGSASQGVGEAAPPGDVLVHPKAEHRRDGPPFLDPAQHAGEHQGPPRPRPSEGSPP